MVISAPAWLSNANLWVVAMGILAFIGALIGARAAWRAAHPRLRLYVAAHTDEAMMPNSESWDWNSLSITYGNRALIRPHITRIEVTNRGNKDVPIGNGHDLRVRLSSEAVSVLGVASSPRGRAIPGVTVEGNDVCIGQGFIPSHYTLSIAVLKNGYARRSVDVISGLPDVEVINEFPPTGAWRWRLVKYLVIPGAVFTLGAWFGAG
ncbi:MAG TPA: hypothetical protein VFP69_16595 [Streptomyces sp.]|nr:hypothetical protein [Streptomyces sp.]